MYANLFDDPDLINRMLGRYLSVTPERIRSAAAEVFRADNRVVMTYVPALPPADEEPGPLDAVNPAGPDGDAVWTRRPLHDR